MNDALAPAKVRRALPVVLLTLFLDLLGFSILFPVFAELMLYYQQKGDGLLAWAMANMQALLPDVSDERMAAFFGGMVLSTYALLQFFSAPLWGNYPIKLAVVPFC